MAQTEIQARRPRGRAELIAALADARSGIRRDSSDLADLANVPKRIRSTLTKAPLGRAVLALVAGLVGSRLFSRKRPRPKNSSPGWFQRWFPDFDRKKLLTLLLQSYLEPDQVDLRALLRERLREFLK